MPASAIIPIEFIGRVYCQSDATAFGCQNWGYLMSNGRLCCSIELLGQVAFPRLRHRHQKDGGCGLRLGVLTLTADTSEETPRRSTAPTCQD